MNTPLPYSCHLLASLATARGPTLARCCSVAASSFGGSVLYLQTGGRVTIYWQYLVTTHPVMAMCGERMPWPYLQAPVEPQVPEV